jgi:tyrosyl-tRNA synthetase
VVTTTITPGLDGRAKQSKSLRNYVALRDPAEEKFGKLMSLPDHLTAEWARVYTDLPIADVEAIGRATADGGTAARDAKLRMAGAVVARYHGTEVANTCRDEFLALFSQRQRPAGMPELSVGRARATVLDVLALAWPGRSNRDLRRLVTQGGVSLNGIRLGDPDRHLDLADGDVLKSGKRDWHRIRITR